MTLDLLDRPIMVGDTVLTKPSYSPEMNCVGTIKKVNGKSVIIEVQKKVRYWDRSTNKCEFLRIDIETIRQLNYEVDINQRDHKEVALEFLKNRKILD